MTKYLLWRWGFKAPSPCILFDDSLLGDHDSKTALSQPIELKPEEEDLPLESLVLIYPAPAKQEYPEKSVVPKKKPSE